jgi:hypothetical protein
MTDLTCGQFEDLSAELALGILEGRERAVPLAHVEHCADCRQDLLAMGAVADRLVELTPSAEPPAGFETRVLARLNPLTEAAARGPVRARRHRRPPPTAWRWAVAAALGIAIGVGGWTVGHHDAPAPSAAGRSGTIRSASFISGNRTIGLVVAYGGAHPWVAMSFDTDLGDRRVTCELIERDGAVSTLGTYVLADGYGYWGAPIGVSPSAVSSVRLVDATGTTVAWARFGSAV